MRRGQIVPENDGVMSAIELENFDFLAHRIGNVEFVSDPVDSDRLGKPQRRRGIGTDRKLNFLLEICNILRARWRQLCSVNLQQTTHQKIEIYDKYSRATIRSKEKKLGHPIRRI